MQHHRIYKAMVALLIPSRVVIGRQVLAGNHKSLELMEKTRVQNSSSS
jgi:hypothetical protein